MAKTNLKIIEKKNGVENNELAAALEVEKKLQEIMGAHFKYLGKEDITLHEKIISLVMDAEKKLSLVKDSLDYCDVDLYKLEGIRFEATVQSVHQIYRILDATIHLHCSTH